MKLYLVQHAEAKDKEEDPERSLTEKGWEDIRKVAHFVAKYTDTRVVNIFHSDKVRAQRTAEVLGSFLNPIAGIDRADGLDPLSDPAIWEESLQEQEENIMLVGHLPHLEKLCSLLLCGDEDKSIVNYHNSGVVCLEKDEVKQWSIQWVLIPKILKNT
jgi:phosphohistidine phosphatase